jgi:ankyrin repeat protein
MASAQRVIAQGVDVSADLNGRGATALHKAAEEADVELLRLLLAAGAAVNRLAETTVVREGVPERWTPLHFAARRVWARRIL